MKSTNRPYAVVCLLLALTLSLSGTAVYAGDADIASRTFAAAQSAKQKCTNSCRARYRDCQSKKQISSFECRNVYRDCTRLTCNGLVD